MNEFSEKNNWILNQKLNRLSTTGNKKSLNLMKFLTLYFFMYTE